MKKKFIIPLLILAFAFGARRAWSFPPTPPGISTASIGVAEMGYLSGVTSAIQTQLNAKAPTANATMTGTFVVPELGFTEKTDAPGSPVVGKVYLADGVTWDPLNKVTTTGAVATIAAADANPDTFTTSAQDFLALGFQSGMTLIVTGAGSNNGTYTIDSVTATVITLIASDALTADAEGDSVTLTGHIPYFVRYTPTGDYIGLEDYQGRFLVGSIDMSGNISGNIPYGTEVSGATALAAHSIRGRIVKFTAAATGTLPAAADLLSTGGTGCVAVWVRDPLEAAVLDLQAGEKFSLNGTVLAAGTAITATNGAGKYYTEKLVVCADTNVDGSGTDGYIVVGPTSGWASE